MFVELNQLPSLPKKQLHYVSSTAEILEASQVPVVALVH